MVVATPEADVCHYDAKTQRPQWAHDARASALNISCTTQRFAIKRWCHLPDLIPRKTLPPQNSPSFCFLPGIPGKMALNLEKQLLFVSIHIQPWNPRNDDSWPRTSTEPTIAIPYSGLIPIANSVHLLIAQVNVAIHITCVPVLLFTGIVLVCEPRLFPTNQDIPSV